MTENVTAEEKETLLKELWRRVFGDSKEYINLIFDNIYAYDISCLLAAKDNRNGVQGIAGMVGIDYYLRLNNRILKGAYICGVATLPDYRKRGIMKKLLEKEHLELEKQGYSFSFLIPSDNKLREYYKKFGYSNFGQKRTLRINNASDIEIIKKALKNQTRNSDSGINLEQNIFENDIILRPDDLKGNEENLNIILDFLNKFEKEINYEIILHSEIQKKIAIEEWLMSEGEIVLMKDMNSLAFIKKESEPSEAEILLLAFNKIETLKSILRIKEMIGELCCKFDIDDSLEFEGIDSLMECKNYAMFNFFAKNENLKFANNISDNFKYSILAKDGFKEENTQEEGNTVENDHDSINPRVYLMMD